MKLSKEQKVFFFIRNTIYIFLIAWGTYKFLYYKSLDRDMINGQLALMSIMMITGITGVFLEIYSSINRTKV